MSLETTIQRAARAEAWTARDEAWAGLQRELNLCTACGNLPVLALEKEQGSTVARYVVRCLCGLCAGHFAFSTRASDNRDREAAESAAESWNAAHPGAPAPCPAFEDWMVGA